MRSLTENEKAALKYFYMPPSPIGSYLITLIPLTVGWSVGCIFFTPLIAFCIAILAILISILIRKLIRSRRVQKAIFIYENGNEGTLAYLGIADNWSATENGWPQQVISLFFNGKPMQIKTFNSMKVKVYTIASQKAYSHEKYPKMIVPSGVLHIQPEPVKKSSYLLFRIIFWAMLTVYAVIAFCNQYSRDKDVHAQPDALVFRINNKPVMATVVSNNENNSNENYCYAECIDLSNGKKLWKIELKAKNNDGNDYGGARLLGMSDKYLFFLHNQLFVIDRYNGKIAAQNKNFPSINNKISRESISDYESDADYVYNDSLRSVVIKGNDGLFYTIDGNTLQTGTVEVANPDTFFKNKFQLGNNYSDQITSVYDDGKQCMALLDTQDTILLATNIYGVSNRSADMSIRRSLYTCPSADKGMHWTKLDPAVFLLGGFLVNASKSIALPMDSLSPASYLSLFIRYNHTNPPMRSSSGGLVIMHKSSTDKNATVLLTGISISGKTLWQLNTGMLAQIPVFYKDEASGELYIFGDATNSNSDYMNTAIAIDLQTGKTRKYTISL